MKLIVEKTLIRAKNDLFDKQFMNGGQQIKESC